MKNELFYNQVSADYDEMISFEKSLDRKKKVFANFIKSELKTAADCGCGTGVDSIALSQLGLKVTAFDPSADMVSKAKRNAESLNEQIEFQNYSIEKISDSFKNRFDLIVSLGNTFANIRKEDFDDSIKKCYELLNPDGTLIIHILNYHKILKEQNRIVNITQGKENYFIRFYDFETDKVNFNILTFKQSNPSEFKLITTLVYPHTIENFENALNNAGFRQPKIFANLNFDEFKIDSSKDIFLRAIKG